MTGKEILGKTAKELFQGDDKAIKAQFHKLALIWHPDHCHDPIASDVFAHLLKMKDVALNGPQKPSAIFNRQSGQSFRMEYLRMSHGQGCDVYVGNSRIAYHVKNQEPLVDRFRKHKWKYASSNMEKEISPHIAQFVREERLTDGSLLIFNRKPNQILMKDLIDLETNIPSVHVSWMITRLLNLSCYLEWSKLSHGAIAPEFLLVGLDDHSISICGPTLFMGSFGDRPKVASNRTIKVANWLTNKKEMLDSRVDLALVRETALNLFKETNGVKLRARSDIRKEIVNWLLSPSARTAIVDYQNWEKALGERKFVHYGKSASEIYSLV